MAESTPEPERSGPAPDATRIATERIVRLAYWVSQRPSFTIAQATLDVPGYTPVPRDSDGRFDLRSGPGEALRKQFQRDLTQLDERFGIQVEFRSDVGEYRVAPPFFTPRERQMVLSALALVEVAGIDDDGAELERLGRALDASGRRVVVSVHAHLQTVRAAIAARHPIAFRYHGRDRVLEPWVIGQWRNHWYVVGHERSCAERRVFRLDRIEAADPPVRVLDDHYEPPADVEPRDELRLDPNDWGRDPATFATVDVHPEHAGRWRDDVGGAIVAGDPESTWVRVEVLVRDRESFRDRVLRMGTHARVHGPPEIVALVDEWLTDIVRSDA